jgi:hypothetical protein
MRRRRALITALAVTAVGLAVVLVFSPPLAQKQASSAPKRAEEAELPVPVEPAFVPPKPVLLKRTKYRTRWAVVRHQTVARRAPSATAAPVATLAARTPEGTSNLVPVLETKVRSGPWARVLETRVRLGVWARVLLPVLPNNSTGWVPRSALGGYQFVTTHLVIDRRRLTATLYRDGRAVFLAPVGVGRPEWPTPAGEFYIRNKLVKYSSPFYGPLAFGTSARSEILTDWPAGGFVGIHGTSEPELIPGRASHGCIRMRNEDIVELATLMPVGTPLTIR